MTNINIVTHRLGSEELAISSVVFPAFGKLGSRARDDVAGAGWFRETTILEHSGSEKRLLVLRSARDRKSQ